jgi:hypothetical protein
MEAHSHRDRYNPIKLNSYHSRPKDFNFYNNKDGLNDSEVDT